MNSWLQKYKISAALDEEKKVLERQPKWRDNEMQQFEKRLRALDDQLKSTVPRHAMPEMLHTEIMRGVRATAESKARRPVWLWVPVPAMALFVLVGLWWFAQRHDAVPLAVTEERTTSFSEVTVTLDVSRQIAQVAPAAALAPLSQEMDFLRDDFEKTAAFLLASLP